MVHEQMLYVAVEVSDESVIIDDSASASWNTQDGCELYLDPGHDPVDSPARQFQIRGPAHERTTGAIRSGWSHDQHGYACEWGIDLTQMDGGPMVRGLIQMTSPALWLQVQTDRDGRATVLLPGDVYEVTSPVGEKVVDHLEVGGVGVSELLHEARTAGPVRTRVVPDWQAAG